ncbi:hypothetical protein MCEGEM3_02505 [Oxalobacteraceae bacterium]
MITSCGKKTYEDCLLENSKDITNPDAAMLIAQACKKKYSETFSFEEAVGSCKEKRELSDSELQLLDGRGDISLGYFHGTVYNGNENIKVEELTIGIKYNAQKEPSEIVNPFEKFAYRSFITAVTVLPSTASEFSVKVLPKSNQYENIKWQILSAKTCKLQ